VQQAEVLAFNDIIRNGVPARSAVFGAVRLELIRSKDFAKWCRENAEVVRSSGLLKHADVDVEKMTKALAELLIERRCLVNAQRKFLKPPPGQRRLIKFPKKVLPVAGAEGKLFHEDGFMCWTYDRPMPTWVYVVSALCAVGVVLLCLFPVAPTWVKIGVMYFSTTVLAVVTSLLVIRMVIALLSYIVSGRTVWVYPNVLDDTLSFWDAFKPVLGVEVPELSTTKDRLKHYAARLVMAVTVGIVTVVLYQNTPGQESLKKNVGRYRDDLFDYFNVYNNRDMLGDGKKEGADSSEDAKKADIDDPFDLDLDDLDFDDLDLEDAEVPDKEL
jgi:translocation protein SEC62